MPMRPHHMLAAATAVAAATSLAGCTQKAAGGDGALRVTASDSALRIGLAKFFRWTGAMLVVVAAGVLAYGIHDLHEADFLPGLRHLAFDISTTVPPDSWYGTLLKGVFNFQPDPTVLQVVVWTVYVIPVMALFLAPQRGPRVPEPRKEKESVQVDRGSGAPS